MGGEEEEPAKETKEAIPLTADAGGEPGKCGFW